MNFVEIVGECPKRPFAPSLDTETEISFVNLGNLPQDLHLPIENRGTTYAQRNNSSVIQKKGTLR